MVSEIVLKTEDPHAAGIDWIINRETIQTVSITTAPYLDIQYSNAESQPSEERDKL